MDTSRQVGQVVVDPGRTECTVRGATELGVMPGDGYKKVGTWRVRLCFGKDLGRIGFSHEYDVNVVLR